MGAMARWRAFRRRTGTDHTSVPPVQNIIIEDQEFEIIVGEEVGDRGFYAPGMGSLPIPVEIDGHELQGLYITPANNDFFMIFSGRPFPAATSLYISLVGASQMFPVHWEANGGAGDYAVTGAEFKAYIGTVIGKHIKFIIHSPTSPPPPDDEVLDIDHDGLPDTVLYEDPPILVTEDDDSLNVDLDGDDNADITIPKP